MRSAARLSPGYPSSLQGGTVPDRASVTAKALVHGLCICSRLTAALRNVPASGPKPQKLPAAADIPVVKAAEGSRPQNSAASGGRADSGSPLTAARPADLFRQARRVSARGDHAASLRVSLPGAVAA